MKKILVCVLSIALALGMMPVAIGAANPGVVAEVKKSGNTVTVTVKLPAVTKLTACVVSVEFDPDIVSIPDNTSGYAATRDVEGETIPYFIGEHTGGLPDGMDDIVKNAYVNSGSVTKTEETPFAVFTFTVIDTTAVATDFIVNLEQFYAEGLTIADGEGMIIIEKNVAIAGDDSEDDGDEDAAAALAKQIKEFLKQIGLESLLEDEAINDMIEQFADLFGGGFGAGDFEEILDQIIGGDSGGFSFDEIIAFFTDLIDQIMALFNGGTTTTKPATTTTTTTTTTAAEDTTEETTGSSDVDDGEHSAGDAGIALAVTVCLAAAAAFVLAKKRED